MAFVRSVKNFEEHGIDATILENDEEILASVCLGYDDETHTTFHALVALPRYLPRPNGRELQFELIETVTEDGEELLYTLKDGLQSKRFLQGDDREFALSCICSLAKLLVDNSKPDTIVMMTVTPNLPKKALAKYRRICDSLRDVGYDGRRDSPFHGTEIWIMSRITNGT